MQEQNLEPRQVRDVALPLDGPVGQVPDPARDRSMLGPSLPRSPQPARFHARIGECAPLRCPRLLVVAGAMAA